MVHCVVAGCSNKSENSSASFFKFPKFKKTWKSNRDKVHMDWVVKINRLDTKNTSIGKLWMPDENAHVCSDHFTKECFTMNPDLSKSLGYKQLRLKTEAFVVPTLFLQVAREPLVPKPVLRQAYAKRLHLQNLEEIFQAEKNKPKSKNVLEKENVEVSKSHTSLEIQCSSVNITENIDTVSEDEVLAHRFEKETQTQKVKTYSKQTQTKSSTAAEGTQTKIRIFRDMGTMTEDWNCCIKDKNISEDFADIGKNTLPYSDDDDENDDDEDDDEGSDDDDEEDDDDWTPEKEGSCLSDDSDIEELDEKTRMKEIDITDHENADPISERKYIVFESCLKKLFLSCRICNSPCTVVVKKQMGSMVTIERKCDNLKHYFLWNSQPENNKLPLGNLLLCGSILFSGSNITDTLNVLKHLNILSVSRRTYGYIQRCYLIPSVNTLWQSYQRRAIHQCSERRVKLGGDARCSSPGHTAKYGSYTLMDLETGQILDMQLIQLYTKN